MVLWLDDHIGRDENCRALKMEFRQITDSLKMVDSIDSCRQCLRHLRNQKLFCIIQGTYAKEIVDDIVQFVSPSKKPIVYVFTSHTEYLPKWIQEQECIMNGGVFKHEKYLLEALRLGLNDYIKQESVKSDQYFQSELVSKFLEEFTQRIERCWPDKGRAYTFK
jgi:hypothetical protein